MQVRLIPLSMTIMGEPYSLQGTGAGVQALFSSVWGLASIAGPLIGGYVTDALSWRWVFYLNLPFGVLGAVGDRARLSADGASAFRADGLAGGGAPFQRRHGAADRAWRCDHGGPAPGSPAAAGLLAIFVLVERRTADPILPLDLFRPPHRPRSLVVVFMTGMAMFGAIAFVPLFVQGVMGGTATEAGQVLTPLFLGWVGDVRGGRAAHGAHRLSDRRVRRRPRSCWPGSSHSRRFQPTRTWRWYAAVFVLGCGIGSADAVVAAGGAARRRALAARAGDIAESVLAQRRRGGRRGGDGRDPSREGSSA